ncbi:hypothetical protein, partial [Dialister histaminiformans]|uniref:hypothetical protein n=1 Tax=Allisonella histaminiformans TaxID=209880 RepID=UPI001F245260
GIGFTSSEAAGGLKSSPIYQMGPKVLAGKSWEGRTAGGKSPCGSTFSDHPMDNLTSQRHLLNIEIFRF